MQEQLQKLELMSHNLVMALPVKNSVFFKKVSVEEWEVQAAIHFIRRISEASRQAREELKRQEEQDAKEKKR